MSRQVVFYGAITLDGYLADDHDNLDWLLNLDTDINDADVSYPEFIKTVDTTLSGKNTYLTTKALLDGADFYPDKTNYVFSKSLTTCDDGQIINDESATDFVRRLKQQSGQNIWIIGGGPLLSELLASQLVDQLQVQITPILLGSGKRLFDQLPEPTQLTLTNTTHFGSLAEVTYTIEH